MGRTPQGRTRYRKIPGSAQRHPPPGPALRSGSSLSPLFPDQSRAYALSRVPRPRLVHFHRRCRGWMQSGHWHAPQTRRYALDQARRQRHHCSPLFKTQWSFSRLLGAQIRTLGRMTHHFLGVRPISHASLVKLVDAFRRVDYFSLAAGYASGVTDMPTYVTSISFDGMSKSVLDYVGREAGMPRGVSDVELAIDRLSGASNWIKRK